MTGDCAGRLPNLPELSQLLARSLRQLRVADNISAFQTVITNLREFSLQ